MIRFFLHFVFALKVFTGMRLRLGFLRFPQASPSIPPPNKVNYERQKRRLIRGARKRQIKYRKMAYSKNQNILFIHVPKNAGKSIEYALGIASIEIVNSPGQFRSPLNRVLKKLLYSTNDSFPKQNLFGPLDIVLCAQHLSLLEIENLSLLPRESFREARKFAVVRNPFDRAISVFRRFNPKFELEDFKRFWSYEVDNIYQDHGRTVFYRSQFSYVADLEGKVAVDRVLKFENLERDFLLLCEDWKLEVRELKKIGKRPEATEYKNILDLEAREILESRFSKDLEVFDYQY